MVGIKTEQLWSAVVFCLVLVAEVLGSDQAVITLERLEGQLVLGLHRFGAHLLDLVGEDFGSGSRAVDTVGLDGDEDTATNLEEPVGVHGDDTGLVGLSNIGEDDVDHRDNHAVTSGLTGILNNGDDVGALGSHGDQITTRALGELDSVDVAGRTNEVSDVRDGSTRGTTKVEDARSRLHVDVIGTTGDSGAKLAAEGVPHAVLDLGRSGCAIVVLNRLIDRNALLAVDRLARSKVAGGDTVLLAATDNEDSGVAMGLL